MFLLTNTSIHFEFFNLDVIILYQVLLQFSYKTYFLLHLKDALQTIIRYTAVAEAVIIKRVYFCYIIIVKVLYERNVNFSNKIKKNVEKFHSDGQLFQLKQLMSFSVYEVK